jgi:hypothetical protein
MPSARSAGPRPPRQAALRLAGPRSEARKFPDDQRHRSRRPVGRIRHYQQLRPVLPGSPRRPAAVAGPPRPATWPAGSSPTRTTSTTRKRRNSPRPREHCPHPDARAGHVIEFAKILTGLHGDRLDDWLAAAGADDQPDLHSFAYGIKRDQQAVLNRLTMPWNSGVVGGNVSRLKMIKRQMYGRATFPCSAAALLCQRLGRDGVETITKYGPDPK